MLFSIILLLVLISIPLIYFLVPRGNALHEILHLPGYWITLSQVDTRGIQDQRIPYGSHFRQYYIFIPPSEKSQLPDKIIIYFHGGGWKFGRPEHFKASIRPFHLAGYPVILPSLRRTPYSNYYDMREDLNQLLLSILSLQKKHGWKGQKIVLGGMSAGGNLASLLCFDRRGLAAIGQDQSIFAGLLACAAPLALDKMRSSLLLRAFAGTRDSTQFRMANPREHLSQTDPIPVFCVHGLKDGLVEFESSSAFVDTLTEIHPEQVSFIALPEGTHLDVAAWGHKNQLLQQEILTWLKKL